MVVSARGHASGVMQRQDMPAPKGRDMPAQGNALGLRGIQHSQALKGRDITVAVRGGGNFLVNRYSVMTRRERGCFQTILPKRGRSWQTPEMC